MLKASARVLRLLSLLQARREWSGAELSEKLEVHARTIRRDVDRLRELGYVIDASAGPGGGYRLGAGSATPPLLLDDDEAIAVAVALTSAAGSIANIQDLALRVLGKLDQLMPSRLRRRLRALEEVTLSLPGARATVDHRTLAAIASSCRDHLRLSFAYRDQRDQRSTREIEPMRLVHTGRVWYLAAWDIARDDWRTFRVDRIDGKTLSEGERFIPRPPPEDFAKYVSRSIASARHEHRARVEVKGAIKELEKKIPSWVGVFEPAGKDRCVLTVGGETLDAVAALLILSGVEFTLLDPPELASPLKAIAARLSRGAGLTRAGR